MNKDVRVVEIKIHLERWFNESITKIKNEN